MKRYLLILAMAVLAVGCERQPTKLEKAISTLKPGMSEGQVKLAFKGFGMPLETNEPAIFSNEHHSWDYQDQLFGTNKEYAYRLQFSPEGFGLMECCFVFLDTNKIIVARRYICMH